MSSQRTMDNITTQQTPTLSKSLVFTMATGAGLSVASIYYNQPMLGNIGATFHADVSATGFIPTFTQVGYALGILFLIPLGDRFDRRNVIAIKSLLLALALFLCSIMPSLNNVLVASLAIGIMATMAQDIVPAAANLAPEAKRGKTVGTVMTGLLVGILLSRVISGAVSQYLGWQAMYQLAALSILLIGLSLWRILPSFEVHSSLSYPGLLKSMLTLWKRHDGLRRAAFAQGLLSVGFSAFWSTLAVMLHTHYGLGSAVAGAFGLAGAAGALAAPLAGTLADKSGPARVTQIGCAMFAMSFAIMFLLPYFPVNGQIALIIVSALGFDLGIQATLVSHQSLVYGLDPTARGRLNALLFTGMFIGMSIGSVLGSQALALLGWNGVVAVATITGILAFIIRITDRAV
ncbi:Inner membrane transport protein YnfM [Marinomonas spartinae]|uniref:Inner membrane transport protein YnfM n=1 Tax=Marinomonas spartinae TaxID=1792290 RepID=A0A1A8T263_9GAMM|nr:MFS transporter [Marinomonas spartinae]SBS26116.1 Inner membrane transport protein YnfM [Marinomonas spartinae]